MKKIKLFISLLLPVLLLTGCGNKSYIEIKGDPIITHTYGEKYNDEGYELKSKKVTVTVNNNVDINKLGEQQVTYIVLKENKEVERMVRIVKVVDDKAPEIECLDEIELFLNTNINDDKLKEDINLSIKDNYDKTENIKVELSYKIDVTKEGKYKLNIKAVDTNNNESSKDVNVNVTKIHITKISLNKTSLNLIEGGNSTLSVTYYPSNATDDKTVVWSSSNENVAKVSNGKVSAIGIGNAKICATLKDNTKIQSCTDVNVIKIHITKISLNKTSLNLIEGGNSILSVTYYPSNATDDKTVIWSSSNENVAKVSNGKVSAIGIGNTKICATLKDNTKIQSCADVNVTESQILKFQNFLISNGYVKKSSTLYQKYGDGHTYTVDFTNKTFISDDGEGPLTYYYKNGKGKYIFYYSNGAIKTINYVYSTNEYNCSVTPISFSELCSNVNNGIKTLNSLKNLFDTMINASGVNVSGL